MPLKTVEVNGQTYAEIKDGKPVWVEADGKETAFDIEGTRTTISRLNGEAKTNRERYEAAEGKLKDFEGIDDPRAAKDALSKVKNLNAGDLKNAEEVERIKQEAIKAKDAEYKPVIEERDSLRGALHQEKIGGSFARSKFIADKLAIPADLVEARFGRNFDLKDGKIVAKDSRGNEIFSKARPGELADFDEAMEVLVEQYPQRDSILKGSGSTGSGTQGNQGNGTGGKTMKRSEFDSKPVAEQGSIIRSGVAIVD